MQELLFSFLFFLPAGIANMVPVLVAKVPGLQAWKNPLDFGKKFKGKRILGDHKTIRGLVSGVVVGILISSIERSVILDWPGSSEIMSQQYIQTNPIMLGFLLSFGALAGDSVKSFFKRQIGISSGKSWFPFDQIDYVIGGLAASLLVIRLPVVEYGVIFLLYVVLHLLTSAVGFFLKLKDAAI